MSTAHVPPGEGKSTWIANDEFVTFKATGKDTGEVFALVEVVGLPGSGLPSHIHPCVDEGYYLQEGELDVLNGDQTFTAIAGSVFHIPRGTLRAWRNATTPARTLLFIAPAGFERFFEEAAVPGTDLSSPPPPPTPGDFRRYLDIGQKYDTEYSPVPSW